MIAATGDLTQLLYRSQTTAEPEEKVGAAVVTEAVPAELAGPTVNIPTAEAEPVQHAVQEHTEPTVKTVPAGPPVTMPDFTVQLESGATVNTQKPEAVKDNIVESGAADSVSASERVAIPSTVLSEEEVEVGASDRSELTAEVQQPKATTEKVDNVQPADRASPEPTVLSSSAAVEREIDEQIDEEGNNAGMQGEEVRMDEKMECSRFTVEPVHVANTADYGGDYELPSPQKEDCLVEAGEGSFQLALEQSCSESEVTDSLTCEQDGERTMKVELSTVVKESGERGVAEVDGKKVQFSAEVQYFKEEEFPTELEHTIEEEEEERSGNLQCSEEEDKKEGFPDTSKGLPLPYEKERYHYAQESSDDELERTEEGEGEEKGEEEMQEHEQEQHLEQAEEGEEEEGKVWEQVGGELEAREELEVEEQQTDILKRDEMNGDDQNSSSQEVTQAQPWTPEAPLLHAPPVMPKPEVTPTPAPLSARPGPITSPPSSPLTGTNLPLIIIKVNAQHGPPMSTFLLHCLSLSGSGNL